MKRFASLEFNRFLEYYRFAEDLNVYERKDSHERASRKANMDLLFINLGKMDHIGPKDLLMMISQVGKLKPHQVGDIRLKGAYSFVEVPANVSDSIIKSFNGFIYRGRKVRIEIQNEKSESFKEKPRAHKGNSREMQKPGKKKSSEPYKGRKWWGGMVSGERWVVSGERWVVSGELWLVNCEGWVPAMKWSFCNAVEKDSTS